MPSNKNDQQVLKVGIDTSGAEEAIHNFRRIMAVMEEAIINTRRQSAIQQTAITRAACFEEAKEYKNTGSIFKRAQEAMRNEIRKTTIEQKNYLKVVRDAQGNIGKIKIVQAPVQRAPTLMDKAKGLLAGERAISPGINDYGERGGMLQRFQKVAAYAGNIVNSVENINEAMNSDSTSFVDNFSELNKSAQSLSYMLGPSGPLIIGVGAAAMATGKWLGHTTGLHAEYEKDKQELEDIVELTKKLEESTNRKKRTLERYREEDPEYVKQKLASAKAEYNRRKDIQLETPSYSGYFEEARKQTKLAYDEMLRLGQLNFDFNVDAQRASDDKQKALEKEIEAEERRSREAWNNLKVEKDRLEEIRGIIIETGTEKERQAVLQDDMNKKLAARVSLRVIDPSKVNRENMKPEEYSRYQDELKASTDALAWKKALKDSGLITKETSWKIQGANEGNNGMSQIPLRSLVVAEKQVDVLKEISANTKAQLEAKVNTLSAELLTAALTKGVSAALEKANTWSGN